MKLWTWLEIHQFFSLWISLWIKFLFNSENATGMSTKNSNREKTQILKWHVTLQNNIQGKLVTKQKTFQVKV